MIVPEVGSRNRSDVGSQPGRAAAVCACRRRILLHVLAEGVAVAAAGAVFGVLLSAAFQDGINQFFQWRYDTSLVFVRITPRIALRSIAFSVPLGVLATLASSWTLLRREMFLLTRR